jgi:hypothetical protein
MKLSSKPHLSYGEALLPGAPSTDERIAVYLTVTYSYTSNSEEVDFLEKNGLKILERVIILGVNPAIPGGDIDLRFNIRPQFDVRPPDYATADDLRVPLKIERKRILYVLKSELVSALNADSLKLNSVKAMVQLSYVHIDYSDSVTIDLD